MVHFHKTVVISRGLGHGYPVLGYPDTVVVHDREEVGRIQFRIRQSERGVNDDVADSGLGYTEVPHSLAYQAKNMEIPEDLHVVPDAPDIVVRTSLGVSGFFRAVAGVSTDVALTRPLLRESLAGHGSNSILLFLSAQLVVVAPGALVSRILVLNIVPADQGISVLALLEIVRLPEQQSIAWTDVEVSVLGFEPVELLLAVRTRKRVVGEQILCRVSLVPVESRSRHELSDFRAVNALLPRVKTHHEHQDLVIIKVVEHVDVVNIPDDDLLVLAVPDEHLEAIVLTEPVGFGYFVEESLVDSEVVVGQLGEVFPPAARMEINSSHRLGNAFGRVLVRNHPNIAGIGCDQVKFLVHVLGNVDDDLLFLYSFINRGVGRDEERRAIHRERTDDVIVGNGLNPGSFPDLVSVVAINELAVIKEIGGSFPGIDGRRAFLDSRLCRSNDVGIDLVISFLVGLDVFAEHDSLGPSSRCGRGSCQFSEHVRTDSHQDAVVVLGLPDVDGSTVEPDS